MEEGEAGGAELVSAPPSLESLTTLLVTLCPLALDCDAGLFSSFLMQSDSQNRLQQFLSDSKLSSLYLTASSAASSAPDANEVAVAVPALAIDFEVRFVGGERGRAVALSKRVPELLASKTLSSQLLFLPFHTDSPVDTLHNYVRNSLAPFLRSFARHSAEKEGSKGGLAAVQQKMNELERSLYNCAQSIDIEEVKLPIHPHIQEAAEGAKKSGQALQPEQLGAAAADPEFLGELQSNVISWIKMIQKVTKLERIESMPKESETVQEVKFWNELERELLNISAQLKQPEVQTTFTVLKRAKRFHATQPFDTDTIGVRAALQKTQSYKGLMRGFPIDELVGASDLPAVATALTHIFQHLLKSKKGNQYPVQRHIHLAEALSRDVCNKTLDILQLRRVMQLEYSAFQRLVEDFRRIFEVWKTNFEQYRDMLRDLAKKRGQDRMPFVFRIHHKELLERVKQLVSFRTQHQELQDVVKHVLPAAAGGARAISEITNAYQEVSGIDVLDLSEAGLKAWVDAVKRYEARIDRVETQITGRLRDRLATTKNAREMFRVFGQFNALFVRPRIRGAIQEYQAQLISQVKQDIAKLHQQVKEGYQNSAAYRMSKLRDLPPTAGSIMWAQQLEHQLDTYMKRVEAVLGSSWHLDVEGQKLKQDGDRLRAKLQTESVFQQWVADVKTKEYQVKGQLLDVVKRGTKFYLDIHFDEQIITLFKEVRNLEWLGFRIPFTILLLASGAKQVYPFAVSLKEIIRSYNQATERVTESVAPLVARFEKDVQAVLSDGFRLRWDSLSQLDPFVRRLFKVVSLFQQKVDEALEVSSKLRRAVAELDVCPYSGEDIAKRLEVVQDLIDELNLGAFSNLDAWVHKLDLEVEQKLAARLQSGVEGFVAALQAAPSGSGDGNNKDELSSSVARQFSSKTPTRRRAEEVTGGASSETSSSQASQPQLRESVHSIVIRNQVMHLEPPLEEARQSIVSQFSDWLAVVCAQKHLQGSRYDQSLSLTAPAGSTATYGQLLSRLPDGLLAQVYALIEERLAQAASYVETWLHYQALWDMDASLYASVGDDLRKWEQLLVEIKVARGVFDNSEHAKVFYPVIVDYTQVRNSVNNKYDFWHRDILHNFGLRVGERMVSFYDTISKVRNEMEGHSMLSETTEGAVSFIIQVQEMKRKVPEWESQVDSFRVAQELLVKQRFQFPTDWLEFDMVEAEWQTFKELLARRENTIATQVPLLQEKMLAESAAVNAKIDAFVTEWAERRPSGAQRFSEALDIIRMFEKRVALLHDEWARVQEAKSALGLDDEVALGAGARRNEKLEPIAEELADLKEVWTQLGDIWRGIDSLSETPWGAIVARKVRTALEDLLDRLKAMPTKVKQYEAFDALSATIKTYLENNSIIVDLKSEALRDRHWQDLRKKLRASWNHGELSLGDIWKADLKKNAHIFKDIITQAQGELALEVFLKQIREFWEAFVLDLVNYRNKTKLIRGWDDMFLKMSDHINSVTAMKMSPYYRVFEAEASSWEDKLNRMYGLFDVWIDVQRRWVYLEGIFSGSAEIAQLLPVETSRFRSINNEFTSLMRKVAAQPQILEVLGIEGIQRSLDRLLDLLTKIQKALGEYLEKQRAAFPRFYFVGDEDLLEIIGNSKDIVKVMKHLKKMFAGITALSLSEEGDAILGMQSREGESIPFVTRIQHKEMKINEWLSAIEREMRLALAAQLEKAFAALQALWSQSDHKAYLEWLDQYPAQVALLATQIVWSQGVDAALSSAEGAALSGVLSNVESILELLAEGVMQDLNQIRRQKHEHLITELVHQRDVIRSLVAQQVTDATAFAWLSQLRFYWKGAEENPLNRCEARMANATFTYGWEYLGVGERLVQTPLTDRCYLTLTQALNDRFGGSPAGPAGTGKTETVKALGAQLGRLVLVFCCDENFDFKAMGRIFVGLCETSSWGVFDEFNRLEERIMSAVSQLIQLIQEGLRQESAKIELAERNINLGQDTGIFITMNPGYAGRQELPDNLKQLFRGIAMIKPDRELIGQVMLFSQGFKTAERLAAKVVPLFILCKEQLSAQSHYDFGLRALKSVLVTAGNLKRVETEKGVEDSAENEEKILIQSVCETVIPKLVENDIVLFESLLLDVFPGSSVPQTRIDELMKHVLAICESRFLVPEASWIAKLTQLYQTVAIRHGVMMVGPSGSGKSAAWQVLLSALERLDGVESVSYVIDAKAISKDMLFGSLEPTTREWTDGLFTHVLRKIIENVRGEANKRHWIVFDGDVDPEWVENLNSVLDDNKLLTLPNGERLALPNNVRILFEVDTLRFATPATVSRCGMIWFSAETVTLDMVLKNYLSTLRDSPLDEAERELYLKKRAAKAATGELEEPTPSLLVQRECADIIAPQFSTDGIVARALEWSMARWHIMEAIPLRLLNATFSLINRGIFKVVEYNRTHPEFPLEGDRLQKYMLNRLLYSILWGFGGSMTAEIRTTLGEFIKNTVTIAMPPSDGPPLLDYFVDLEDGEWRLWETQVPHVEIETHQAASPDVVIPTVDTVRHEEVIHSWLSEHRPLLLCGPPGSGKTMTLFSTLKKLENADVITLNFSSATTPELLLKTFDHHCEYRNTPNGVTLRPVQPGKWLVVFCDEINLPSMDKYGTQRVITFIRQLTERNGFWRTKDHSWVSLERIQFVGACNPPTDPGRVPMTNRFLRFAPLIMVDFPTEPSLHQIYGTFCNALLKLLPELRGEARTLTAAMIDIYLACQKRFTPDMHAHYIFSPRELSRWIRALHEAISQWESASIDQLVRLWLHEGLRLFSDRLVEKSEREWFDRKIDEIARQRFPTIADETLERPVLYSTWTTKTYTSVDREELRDYVKARLRIFYEEELDVKLVLFNEVLDHILRIDRVFRQPQGHALLIGVSGGGKTVLSRFVAWLNGLSVFTIKVNSRYGADDFRQDLRHVMLRAGTKDEKICFIFDESNVLDSNFLELMNTLLASGDVPGLFEGEDYTALMAACKDAVQRKGEVVETEDLYSWFVRQVRANLHVVFTMNPASPDFHNRSATSPALFNRCVLDWFGDWSDTALFQVASEFTRNVDLSDPEYRTPAYFPHDVLTLLAECSTLQDGVASHRDAVLSALVYFHQTIRDANRALLKRTGKHNYLTPRHFLDLIKQFVDLVAEKKTELEEQQLHLNVGLRKLKETEEEVSRLQEELREKRVQLEAKDKLANEKLQQMVGDQQVAEQKRQESLALQKVLAEKDAEVSVKKAAAEADLAKAEPAVEEAKKSVSSIKKSHLDEMRALRKPHATIQLVLEAVCIMLGRGKLSWTDIRKVLMDSSFIPSIVSFDSEQIPAKIRAVLRKDYLSNPSFTFEAAQRASRACGPLQKWLTAQLEFSEILHSVEPLRAEVARLEGAASSVKEEAATLENTIAELEQKITVYKEEYAALIRETEMIKNEMDRVKEKVERSVSLLKNLASESERWSAQSAGFQEQMSTVVGDCLLGASFLSYIGVFDQVFRTSLLRSWRLRLEQLGVKFRPDTSIVDYLANPDERLQWRHNALPADDLCTENAIMLKRFNRYPLIIDPSGQATTFLLNQYRDRKIIKTSFLDASFQKNLESALRFGCPIVVEDVEHIDPILNPILNKEVRKTGGRVLITLGDQDIDFSPTFVIYMTTRDPTAHFTPDLCSRVTFVNFTVTHSGLQAQCLNEVLKSERPEEEKKRTDSLKQQGEFRVQLRRLEHDLLDSLSQAKGNILQDDSVMKTLERLKGEAAEVGARVAAAEGVMEEIQRISVAYAPFARFCSDLYFALEQLASVHFLYQFSLTFFLDIFHWVISKRNPSLEGKTDYNERLQLITRDIFLELFKRVSRGLLNEDAVVLAMRMAQIKLSGGSGALEESAVHFLLRGGESLMEPSAVQSAVQQSGQLLSAAQARMAVELAGIQNGASAFAKLLAHIAGNGAVWREWLASPDPSAPSEWLAASGVGAAGASAASAEVLGAFYDVLLAKALKPARVASAAQAFVSAVFGFDILQQAELDLQRIVAQEAGPHTPLLLCATQGHDPSRLVDDLAARSKKKLDRIALGSPEGFELAERSINAACKAGNWVMLKNIHLAPSWLSGLEKKLHALTPNDSFRLFLTSDIHPKLPASLLRQSRLLTFESPPGVRASMQHTLSRIPAERMARAPAERSRLHFLLAWLHAVVTERLRYAPLGWSKEFEFNETDFSCALDTLDYWIDAKAAGRANLSPDKIPWSAVHTLLGQVVYGGRIDNEVDQALLEGLLTRLFRPQAFEPDFELNAGLLAPPVAAKKRDDFLQWVAALPAVESPAWIGLPERAELVLLVSKGKRLAAKLLKMQSLEGADAEDAGDVVSDSLGAAELEEAEGAAAADAKQWRAAWMNALESDCDKWLAMLPEQLGSEMEVTEQNLRNPMWRFWKRETDTARALLAKIRADLQSLKAVCNAELKQTNYLRSLIADIQKGEIPPSWAAYPTPRSVSLNLWFLDMIDRMKQEAAPRSLQAGDSPGAVWLGGLIGPAAFVTATRQCAAQAHGWSLESLRLDVEVLGAGVAVEEEQKKLSAASWIAVDSHIVGAAWNAQSGRLQAGEEMSSALPPLKMTWRVVSQEEADAAQDAALVSVPLYLNEERKEHLFSVTLPREESTQPQALRERSIAITAWQSKL